MEKFYFFEQILCLLTSKSAEKSFDFDREKKRLPIEFWKKENGDRLEIQIPILT